MDYGKCSKCNHPLEPVWFEDKEVKMVNGTPIHTGRKRIACSYLECPECFNKECVDGSYDKSWHN